MKEVTEDEKLKIIRAMGDKMLNSMRYVNTTENQRDQMYITYSPYDIPIEEKTYVHKEKREEMRFIKITEDEKLEIIEDLIKKTDKMLNEFHDKYLRKL